jgi:MFS-type transporter involved in bile tolerance (Atg22 family)
LAFLSVALWWAVFSIPLFRKVREPARRLEKDETGIENPVRIAFTRLRETFRELRGYKQAFLMLLAFLIYSDGIGTIIRMATIYGTQIGIDQNSMIAAILLTQFIGFPFAFLFGSLAGWIGAKTSIFVGLVVYVMITILAFRIWGVEPKQIPPDYSNTRELGRVLYTDYALAFEIAAVIVVVAFVAASALTLRRRKDSRYQDPSQQVKARREERVRLVSMPAEKEQ